jgi:hypothetical protein
MSSKIKILDAALSELATISVASSAVRTERINSDNTLNFSVRVKSGYGAHINDTSVFELDGDYFDIAYYKAEQQADGALMIAVESEHVSYRLNDADYNVEYFTEIGTPTQILTAILDGTGFTVGTVDFSETMTFSLQQAASRRMLLIQFAAYVGGELEFDGFTISLLAQRGSSTPTALTVGKDITVVSKAVNKRALDALGNPTVSYTCGVYKAATLNLGDVVTINYDALGIAASLRVVTKAYDPYNPNNVTVEIGNSIGSLEDDLYRIETQAVKKDALLNGVRIGPEYGFEAVRNDKLARAYFKSDGMAMQSGDGTGSTWTDRLKYEYDAETGETTLVFYGKLSATVIEALSAVISPNLYAGKATIAELTVDQLDTSDKIQNYLNSSTADVNYIKIYDQYIQFITASTDGTSTVQAVNRDNAPLYWTDSTHTAADTTERTGLEVLQYEYTEAIKTQIAFELEGSNYEPVIVLGQGTSLTETTWGKAYVWKTTTGLLIRQITETGDSVDITFNNSNEIKVVGNTGTGLNIRNIAIGATEPTGAQAGDIWINTGA